ncbi:Glucanase inhibitor protein 2 [Phytophthora cinnamomi]|uniref:Glucanase inhibitor protein 2 n=1 Tax=Phytophthora cinnamomi TaxID=4785 RepID=UPI0035598F46|nr:Glucanase inhibitor protein 2 [Phytophthora cinnamomi]
MGVSQALINAWDFVQVELKGEYSPGRVLALNQYSTSTPWWRIIVLIILTPLPSLIYICLPETVDLAPPYRGMAHNKTFFGRFFLSYTMWCLLQMHMISERMPLLKLTKKQLVISAVTVAVLSTGFELLYAWWIGFPVPYTIHMMAVPYVSLMFFAFAIMWYSHVRQNWGLLWKIADAVLICVCHGLVIIGYPLFYFFFLKMHGIESSAFSLVLPVLKTLYRVMFYYFCRSASGERITIVVVFNADMVNALFVNFCMQYQPSFTTTFTLMLANALQVAVVVWDIDDIRKKIAATAREIVDVRNNDKYSSKLPGERVATFKMLPRAADIFQRYTFDAAKGGPKCAPESVAIPSEVSNQLQLVTPEEVSFTQAGPRSSAIIEPISEHEAPVPAAPAGPRTKSMVKTLSELELLERKYASLVRKLMYASEFSILTAYAEVITPIVYSLYLFIVFHMPNRNYYSQIASMDSARLAKTVLNVLMYSLVELTSFTVLTQTLKKRLDFSTLHQLAYVLDKYMIHVQTSIILWVFYTTQISLEHYGTDYTFRFTWLHSNSTNV